MVANVNYKIRYTDRGASSGSPISDFVAPLQNIRSLAKFLNSFKRKNPLFFIIVVTLEDKDGKFINTVKFLPIEMATQKWLTGYKERLLATALHRGYEIKWNHGLKGGTRQ
jgi:hypothetical protein